MGDGRSGPDVHGVGGVFSRIAGAEEGHQRLLCHGHNRAATALLGRALPRPYWEALRRYSEENGLDPYLVASLIRQESEFNPGAVSHANAYGLMQLLPKTGRERLSRLG